MNPGLILDLSDPDLRKTVSDLPPGGVNLRSWCAQVELEASTLKAALGTTPAASPRVRDIAAAGSGAVPKPTGPPVDAHSVLVTNVHFSTTPQVYITQSLGVTKDWFPS